MGATGERPSEARRAIFNRGLKSGNDHVFPDRNQSLSCPRTKWKICPGWSKLKPIWRKCPCFTFILPQGDALTSHRSSLCTYEEKSRARLSNIKCVYVHTRMLFFCHIKCHIYNNSGIIIFHYLAAMQIVFDSLKQRVRGLVQKLRRWQKWTWFQEILLTKTCLMSTNSWIFSQLRQVLCFYQPPGTMVEFLKATAHEDRCVLSKSHLHTDFHETLKL